MQIFGNRSISFIFFAGLVFFCYFSSSVYAKSSSQDHHPDSIVIEYDPNYDYCGRAWESLPKEYQEKTFTFGSKISLSPEVLFKYSCNQCRDYLSGEIQSIIDDIKNKTDIKAAAKKELDKAQQELKNAFLSWVAEQARAQILPQLSEDDRKKFQSDSDFMQEKAQEFLNQPGLEIQGYVVAYMKENATAFYSAHKAYVDLTSGQSAAILKDLKTMMDQAKDRLNRITGMAEEAQKNPKTPYTTLLKKYGVKGEWIDSIKLQEGRLNAINDTFKVTELVGTIHQSFSSDLPRHKVEAMFAFLDTVSGLAADSNIPIASLMGDIVQNLVKLGKGALEQVVALGGKIQERAGYCLGTFAATEDPRSEALDKKGLTICPIAFERYPWKDIFEETGPEYGRLHFWTGKKFIQGRLNAGGQPAVQEIIKALNEARQIGFDLSEDVETIGKIYNVSFNGGFLGLLSHAGQVVSDIRVKSQDLEQYKQRAFGCSTKDIDAQVDQMTGTDLSAFSKRIDEEGPGRIETAYIFSFLADQGLLGQKNKSRNTAFKTYDQLREQTKNLRFFQVNGEIRDEINPEQSCGFCGESKLDIRVSGGREVRGCEAWKADANGNFSIHAIGISPVFTIQIAAEKGNAKTPAQTIQGEKTISHVRLFLPLETEENIDAAITLPDVIGMDYHAALKMIEAVGLNVLPPKLGNPTNNKDLVGKVEKAIPEHQSILKSGDGIILYLYDEQISSDEVPDLLGKKPGEAEEMLKTTGLTPIFEMGEQTADTALEGTVYRQAPEPGTRVEAGSDVTLTVYDSAADIGTVPDVLGADLAKASKTIETAGFTPVLELGDVTRDPEKEGIIYQQTPEPGTELLPGSVVNLLVYDLAADIPMVPDVIGKNPEKASKVIEQAGFTPVFEIGNTTHDPEKKGIIYRQTPEPGTEIASGSEVTLLVYSLETDNQGGPIPNVMGKDTAAAYKAVKEAGYNPVIELGMETRDSSKDSVVYQQTPKPGSVADSGSDITFKVYTMAAFPAPVSPVIPDIPGPSKGEPFFTIPDLPKYKGSVIKISYWDHSKQRMIYETVTAGQQIDRNTTRFTDAGTGVRKLSINHVVGKPQVQIYWVEDQDPFPKTSPYKSYFCNPSHSDIPVLKLSNDFMIPDTISLHSQKACILIVITGSSSYGYFKDNEQTLFRIAKELMAQIEPYAKSCEHGKTAFRSQRLRQ